MRARIILLALAAGFLASLALAAQAILATASASADFAHTVTSGESLSSIAAADGLTVDQLAAANGLAPDSGLLTGATVQIPPQSGDEGSGSSAGSDQSPDSSAGSDQSAAASGSGSDGSAGAGAGESSTGVGKSSTGAGESSAGAGGGSYVVQPGDTLSTIAEQAGMTVDQLAAENGLDPNGLLISGTVLDLSGGGGSASASGGSDASGSSDASSGESSASDASSGTDSGASASSQPVGAAAEGSSGGPPYPTPETVTAGQVGSIAAANGVSPSLAEAIGYQESGFNNNEVSSADARGVMQILPGTWDWVQRTLTAGNTLDPASAADNVRGGVLLLHSLLSATGGDPAMAAAGYYQGLGSVEQNGMYADTQRYVTSVMALRQRFGGG